MKRVVVISDLHCGHTSGLTPEKWQNKNEKYYDMQVDNWEWYKKEIDKLKPIDILVVNGDAIDGKEFKSGGRELITADRRDQSKIAEECITFCEAKKIRMIYGTGYHTGDQEDWEGVIADNIGAEIKGHKWLNVNGLIFDIKHKVNSSIIPHGRATSIMREGLWNALWAELGGQPRADIFIRSHAHYFQYAGTAKKLYVITPALKTLGDIYGTRQCTGLIDYGFIHFDVKSKDDWSWEVHYKGFNDIISDKAEIISDIECDAEVIDDEVI